MTTSRSAAEEVREVEVVEVVVERLRTKWGGRVFNVRPHMTWSAVRVVRGAIFWCIGGATAITVFLPLARHGSMFFYEYNPALAWTEFGLCLLGALLGLAEMIHARDRSRVFRWGRHVRR
jgi:hypothetical protein